jgi:hypothetical protein
MRWWVDRAHSMVEKLRNGQINNRAVNATLFESSGSSIDKRLCVFSIFFFLIGSDEIWVPLILFFCLQSQTAINLPLLYRGDIIISLCKGYWTLSVRVVGKERGPFLF